jgi:anti-sigma factor RsiW
MTDAREPQDGTPHEIELLLPWYATGKLSDEERAEVERYLADHPAARVNLDEAMAERDGTIHVNEHLPVPGHSALTRLMADISAESGPVRVAREKAPRGNWFNGWLAALSPRAMGAMAAACLAIVAIQAMAIGVLVRDGGSGFHTASGTGETAPAAQIMVAFSPTATAEAITKLLDESGAVIVDGPKAGGIFGLGIAPGGDAAKVLETLKARPDVVLYAAPSS